MWCLPWLIFPLWKWRHPNYVWPVSSDLLLLRITSSGIRGSALVIGFILSKFNFFVFVICLRFMFFSVICALVCVLVCVLLRSCLHLVEFLFVFLFSFLFLFLSDPVSKILFEFWSEFCYKFCLGQFGLPEEFRGLGFSRLLNLFSYWKNCLVAYWIWTNGIDWMKSSLLS